MSDVNCPYCGAEQEINHDDGYGYEEGRDFEQECVSCEKVFGFTTMISFHYEVKCIGGHDMEPAGEKWPTLWLCSRCAHPEFREPSKQEPTT